MLKDQRQPLYAAPLYIVREECEKDLMGVLGKLKNAGFDGIEFLGFFGHSAEDIRRRLDELGLLALGNHVSADDFLKDIEGTIQFHKAIGCSYITISGLPRGAGSAEVKEYIGKIKTLSEYCRKAELTPLYHNHDFEFLNPGSPAVDEILDNTAPVELKFEPDLGWMAFKKADPLFYLIKYRDRCPVIHLKDIYAKDLDNIGEGDQLGTGKALPEKSFFEFRPVGYGMVNYPRLMPAIMDCAPEWLVMDHDMAYERDSYDDLKLSLQFTKDLVSML